MREQKFLVSTETSYEHKPKPGFWFWWNFFWCMCDMLMAGWNFALERHGFAVALLVCAVVFIGFFIIEVHRLKYRMTVRQALTLYDTDGKPDVIDPEFLTGEVVE